MKFIVITGGVVSGLGKGITASSIGILLKNMGYTITMIKIDPYLNIDAGTMSPYEHGEVFVLKDGSETDLDLGNYERFLDITLTNEHNITSGKIFKSVIDDERKGIYLGHTVQVIPHVTDKIKSVIIKASKIPVDNSKKIPDICIIEIGGTIGDIESMHFIEAIRQLNFENINDTFCFIHVSLVTKVFTNSEFKTKPTQDSVKKLRHLGICPDIIIVRCSETIDEKTKQKLSLFCQVPLEHIIINQDVNTIYSIPIIFNKQNILSIIYKKLSLNQLTIQNNHNYLKNIENMVAFLDSPSNLKSVNIIIIGKYTGLTDSYISIIRTLEHASLKNKCKVNIEWLSSEIFEDGINCSELKIVKDCDGIIIPGGFGIRGVEGMINISKYCRQNNKPLLGICLGMHIMCIESARNILEDNCNSTEFDINTPNPIVISIKESCNNIIGGTMKLGIKETFISKEYDSISKEIYTNGSIKERHRHRYEINPKYIKTIEKDKLVFVGFDKTKKCMDIIEDLNHKFYIGCQFHPEFQSSIETPAPLFNKFINIIRS